MDIDLDTIEAARSGGAELDRLIRVIWPDAYRTAFGVLQDRGLAEDAAQEACASIARSLPSLKRSDVFRSWAYRIVVNRAISTGRKHRVETSVADSQAAAPDDIVARLDLYRALERLPLRQRAVVILHYYAGLNSGEIAVSCDLPSSTVRFHLMLARRALRAALDSIEPLPTDLTTKGVSHGL
jgi:RNA polymerase sigma-70 factor, ECF subfamily